MLSVLKLRTVVNLAVLSLAAGAVAGEPGPSAPRDPFRVAGYVPVGFRGFGTWTARKETPLYVSPDSRRLAATITRCEEVTAQDGELRGRPWEMRVLKAHPPFRKGETFWVLARDLEEGYFQLWYRGQVRDDVAGELADAPPFGQTHCSKASARCWLRVDKEPRQVHWVHVRKRDGTSGWSDRASDFGEGPAKENQCP